jgi:hypothetical protein
MNRYIALERFIRNHLRNQLHRDNIESDMRQHSAIVTPPHVIVFDGAYDSAEEEEDENPNEDEDEVEDPDDVERDRHFINNDAFMTIMIRNSYRLDYETIKLNEFKEMQSKPPAVISLIDCSICLEKSKNPLVSLCGHVNCLDCWMMLDIGECPICKREILMKDMIKLYH